jgi:HK97 family phage prohead protease
MSGIVRKFVSSGVVTDGTLGDRQIRVVASDRTIDRVKDIMVPEGCILDGYKTNPIFLFNHNPAEPVGNATVAVQNGRVEALVNFAPKGVSTKADEICALYKAGVLRAVSVGFEPIEYEPTDDGGKRYTKWALMELSGVSVPANPNALTIERSQKAATAGTPQKAASWWPRDLTKAERDELKERREIRAQGPLRSLEGEALSAWLRAEFPGLDQDEAFKERLRQRTGMTLHERFMERKRESDFAKRHDKVEVLRSETRETITAEVRSPPPYISAAHWCAEIRARDEERARELMLRGWRR